MSRKNTALSLTFVVLLATCSHALMSPPSMLLEDKRGVQNAPVVSISQFENFPINGSPELGLDHLSRTLISSSNDDYFVYSHQGSWGSITVGYINLTTFQQYETSTPAYAPMAIEITSNDTIIVLVNPNGGSCIRIVEFQPGNSLQITDVACTTSHGLYDQILLPDSDENNVSLMMGNKIYKYSVGAGTVENYTSPCPTGYFNSNNSFVCTNFGSNSNSITKLIGDYLLTENSSMIFSTNYTNSNSSSQVSKGNLSSLGFIGPNFTYVAGCYLHECIFTFSVSAMSFEGQTYGDGLGDVWIDLNTLEINDLRDNDFGKLLYTDEFNSLLPTRIYFITESVVINGDMATPGFIVTFSGEDYDEDGIPDSLDNDDDNDGTLDLVDLCQQSINESFISSPSSDHDADGCEDYIEDEDNDNDGLLNVVDGCPIGLANWMRTNLSDGDGDGCSDLVEDYDDDNDGVMDSEDACPRAAGTSNRAPYFGCHDGDGDGVADVIDLFPTNSSEWSDVDGDTIGDNFDVFPTDGSQWLDSDGDGYGDNPFGNNGDGCISTWGNSTMNLNGCPDADGDGYSDLNDRFPYDPTNWQDSDSDGVADLNDAFPFNAAQSVDSDGDGYGDNRLGGSGSDLFPNDITQWSDIDGDGYGDNQNGTNPDAFIADPTQWLDTDQDGYGDNPGGRLADTFPDDPTQWEDMDGDGLGDNLSGNNPDPFLFDFDNDGYNDSIDPLPKLASPGDMDNDGTPDTEDIFPSDAREWADSDGDGEGDNADTDDDNDGWPDSDEIRSGTDPYSSSSQPVDTFEIVVPGTAIGLGAWDLIGIFGGVPLFAWIGFGFVTRNSRAGKFETRLKEAKSRNELEEIATQWEYALMLRLIGPHQGIRLERLRSELDDWFENQSQPLASVGTLDSMHQTHLVENEIHQQDSTKEVPSIDADTSSLPNPAQVADSVDETGYEWFTTDDGTNFYRTVGSSAEWVKFEN